MKSKPVRIAFILPERVWAGSVYLTQELLLVAGTLLSASEDIAASMLFEIHLLAAGTARVKSFAGLPIKADLALADSGNYKVVIVPAQFAPTGEMKGHDSAYAGWLTVQHAQGALIVSLNGAVLLAKSGLLNDKQATGPISERAIFARHFPKVRFTPGKRIVVNDQIICCGGINPTVDVCAYIIERFFGQHAARKFVRHTTTDTLQGHEHLAVWSAQFKQHKDAQVLAAQHIVESSLAHMPDLTALAAAVHVSKRSLSRRFTDAVGTSLRSYVAECRLEMARLLLRTTDLPLTLLADECGFGSTSSLVHAFSARFGSSPLRYRQLQPGSSI
ncbi:MAG: helix-turn-helix domain-containing protein [Burkholderiaceae bacterium]|nr:helix-turn-helix domain-containing protein [Burkholderiaceae bacterium]